MQTESTKLGLAELVKVRKQSRNLYWFIAVFSFFMNLLMLTGPLYMLQVYDRVLGSRSEATLIALSIIVVFLFCIMGILDYTRGRVMARAGARFQSSLDQRVFDATIRASSKRPGQGVANGLSDLEAIQKLMGSPVVMAIFDLPWTPIFLAGILLFHPWLGVLAIAGGAVLLIITLMNQLLSKKPQKRALEASVASQRMSDHIRNEAETIQSIGMRRSSFLRWNTKRSEALEQSMIANDVTGTFTTATKTFRMFLQSAMLGLGAYLVLQDQITPGAMIAASILLGRALAPVEMAVNQWPVLQRARVGWVNLSRLLSSVPAELPRTELSRPKAVLSVEQLVAAAPGERQPILKNVSFDVAPGTAVGVVGSSGSGKSSLAKVLTGIWKPLAGNARLDGASLEHYGCDALGRYVGYLPQKIELFDGTIAENIARLEINAPSEKVIEAARKAGAHDMILNLPDGYDTRISASGSALSGGQMQRIGLARALYDNPVIVILDEPNSNLDSDGSLALNSAIRGIKSAGGSVIIMAHRPSAIQECESLLVLDHGNVVVFGPRDEVLRGFVKDASNSNKVAKMGAVR